jgi:hypothetical protein
MSGTFLRARNERHASALVTSVERHSSALETSGTLVRAFKTSLFGAQKLIFNLQQTCTARIFLEFPGIELKKLPK